MVMRYGDSATCIRVFFFVIARSRQVSTANSTLSILSPLRVILPYSQAQRLVWLEVVRSFLYSLSLVLAGDSCELQKVTVGV